MSQIGLGQAYNANNTAPGFYNNSGDMSAIPWGSSAVPPGVAGPYMPPPGGVQDSLVSGNSGQSVGTGYAPGYGGTPGGMLSAYGPGAPSSPTISSFTGGIGGGAASGGHGGTPANPNGSSYYGPNTYDNNQFQAYDPSGGMGYGYGASYPMVGGSLQTPSQLGAISQQYAAQQAAAGNVGAAQAQAQGNVGAAQASAGGQVGAAQQAANASEFGSTAGLQGTENTNATNQNIAGINSQTQLGLGQLGLQGTQTTAGDQLQGTQTTAADALAAAQAQAAASENVATTTTAPSLLKAQALTSLLANGGGLGALSGLGGGAAGGGGLGVGAGVGTSGAGTDTGTGSAPAMPNYQQANSQNTLQNFNQLMAQDQQQNATNATGQVQDMANRGFNNTSMAGGSFGLNTGGAVNASEGNTLNQQALQQGMSNTLQAENLANQQNTTNQQQDAQIAMQDYLNPQYNRALQLAGLSLTNQGQLLGALS